MGCRNSKPHHHAVQVTIDNDGDARITYGDEWGYTLRRVVPPHPWWWDWWKTAKADSLEEFAERIEATARQIIARHDKIVSEGVPSDLGTEVAARLNRELAKAGREPTWPDEWQGAS